MALPGSGTISMGDMRTEFGYSGTVDMNTFYVNRYTPCRGGGYAMSDWYGYIHAPCTTNVYITLYAYPTADGSGNFTVAASSSVAVNTDVTTTFTLYGDLSGYVYNTITIYNGSSCNSGVYGGGSSGENVTSLVFNAVSPTSYSSYDYYDGGPLVTYSLPC